MQLTTQIAQQSQAKKRGTNKAAKVLVLGGNGFIGRYTTAVLARHGVTTTIGTRRVKHAETERQIKLHKALSEQAWEETLKEFDAVINTVGILRERKNESFDQVHHLAVGALARACKKRDIPLLHMSALGIDQLSNEFAASKRRGETAILNSGCRGAIVRASIVNALDGYGASWMYRVATWPIWLLPGKATKLLCPVEAKDLGEALANLTLMHLQNRNRQTKVIEIGGPEVFTLKTYLRKLRAQQDCLPVKPFLTIRIPNVIARLFAKIFDMLHLTPYSVGHHELLEFDNIPHQNSLAKILGRKPTEVGKNPNEFPILLKRELKNNRGQV